MKRFACLLRLEIKKYLKAYPWMLFSAILLLLIVAGIGMTATKMMQGSSVSNVGELLSDATGEEGTQEKLTIAIAVQDSSKAVQLAKSMLKNMNSVQAFLEIRYVDEKEGKELLKKHEAVVLLVVREKTIAGILDGSNVPVEVIFPEDSGYEAAIFQEFADAAVKMLSSAQAAVYANYDFFDYYEGRKSVRGKVQDRINMQTIAAVLGRESLYVVEEVTVTGEITVPEYYFCSGIVMFVMLFAIVLTGQMKREDRTMGARLKMAGTGYVQQVIASLAGVVVSYLLVLLPVALVLPTFPTGFLCVLPLVILCEGAFALLLCRLTQYALTQIMLLFLTAVMQGLICGCFVPEMLLPEVFGEIAGCLPAQAMIDLFKGVLLEEIPAGACVILLGYTVVFLLLTVFWEWISAGGMLYARKGGRDEKR